MSIIKQLIQDYKSKRQTPSEVIKSFIKASKAQNQRLNAFTTFCEQFALTEAKQIKTFDQPLAGVPVAIKDNFCTEGIRTTASARLLDDFIPSYDATVVTRLRQAGAIIIGKTNMDAWAHGSSTETSDYGPTKNPHDLTRVPGGSSGGSAAAVAAGIVPIAIGSETAGSIRQPASWSGVVGLKPTYGRVSRYGVIAMGSSLDCPGPLTKTIEDAAIILQVLAGYDNHDATTSQLAVPDYGKELKLKKTFTIGISDDYLEGVSDEVKQNFMAIITFLKKLGHKIKKVSLINPKYAISVYTIINRAEVSSNLCRYDGVRYAGSRSEFSEQAKRRIMLGTYTLSSGYYDAYYLKAQKVRTLIIEDLKKAFQSVDLIAAPTAPTTALALGESKNNPMFGEMMDVLIEASSMAGTPGISIPTGLDKQQLPFGVQFFAPWFKETDILNLAYQYEQETQNYLIRPSKYYEL